MALSNRKNDNNSKKIEIQIAAKKLDVVFLTGSQTTPKRVETTTAILSISRTVPNKDIDLVNTRTDTKLQRLQSPSEFCKDEFSGSKESDCAIGSRLNHEKTCTEFNIEESLYWNQESESNIHNKVDLFNNLLPVEAEQQDIQESPVGGCLFEEAAFTPEPTMSNPFYEDYLDLGRLFPELDHSFDTLDIPCIDNLEKGKFTLPETSTLDIEDPSSTAVPEDIMSEIDNLLKEADLSTIDSSTVEELLNIEVVDEAPTDNEQADMFSSCVSSPGSILSTGESSCTTIDDDIHIDNEMQSLLELLEKSDTQLKSKVVDQPTCAPQSRKRKADNTSEGMAPKKPKMSEVVQVNCSDKATQRRIKNNAASRNCRASRRQREQELFVKEEELLKSNTELKAQLDKLTKETEALRKVLIMRLSSGNVIGAN